MGKPISLFFLISSCLFTTLSYQNCAEVENSSAFDSEVMYLPLYTNQTKLIDDKLGSESGCNKMDVVMFSESHNICFEVNNNCLYKKLMGIGFRAVNQNIGVASNKVNLEGQMQLASMVQSESSGQKNETVALIDRIKNCQISIDIRELKPADFVELNIKDLGYIPPSATLCAMKIEAMVNFKYHTCVIAPNSCASSFLKEQGYLSDFFSMCPQG